MGGLNFNSFKMKASMHFDSLVSNGFDFLETAIQEFKEKPKYSLIHFAAGIELILKSRLLQEHWSLIIDGKPNLKRFEVGDFKSINYSELIPRIEDILKESISEDIKKCFKSIGDHRNKMIHFFHELEAAEGSEKIIREVAIEQSKGWFYLNQLIGKWYPIYESYKDKINSLEIQMRRHQEYLKAVYEQLKPEIEKEVKKDVRFRRCGSCKQPASKVSPLSDTLSTSKCLVCSTEESLMQLECYNCEKKVEFSEYDFNNEFTFICKCSAQLDQGYIKEILDTNPATTGDYLDFFPINCAECSGYDTVVQHYDFWVCTQCLNVNKEMNVCGWCNEGQIGGGEMEYSELNGCEFCEGKLGWFRDK